MRILLSCDLEGVHGVVHSSQTQPGEPHYDKAVMSMHKECNAVIEGALAAGAHTIVVNDSHFDMRNLRLDYLHSKAKLISGWQKPYSMMAGTQGLTGEKAFDVVFFLGYHAKAGTARGVLSHTYRSQVFLDVKLNGESVGETALNAALAGYFGVPVGFVSGDDACVEEAEAILGSVVTVATKKAISRYSAMCLSESEVLEKLKTASHDAVKKKDKWCLYKLDAPVELTIAFMDTAMADGAELVDGVKRVSDREVTFRHDDYAVVFKTMLALGAIGASRKDPHF